MREGPVPIHLHSVETAVPAHMLDQSLVAGRARVLFGERYPQFERMSRSFETSGVVRRYSVAPLEWFDHPHGWAERNGVYLSGAVALFEAAAGQALEAAGWRASEVDVIVTVSSTGIATPTLEALAADRMGFRTDVLRVPVFGLGCAGGVAGLNIAQGLAAGHPGARVLLVVIEACTVSFRVDRLQKADIIAAILFGDGGAAACLSSDPAAGPSLAVLGTPYQQTWPDTLRIMGWDVDDEGLGVVFDRAIPDFVREEFAAAAVEALARNGLARDEVVKFVCHPGGAKVLEAIEEVMELPQGELAEEREVLRSYGNMSAPTVLFVLKAVLQGQRRGRMLACALGPGFTASFLGLDITGASEFRRAA